MEECKRRDVKGMYAKALKGEIKNFTGVDDPYEEPVEDSTTVVDSENTDVDSCIEVILKKHYKQKKHSLFIGRWQPLHEGHKKLFDQVRKEGRSILIGVRDTGIDKDNPYSVQERIEMIKTQVPDAEIVVVPDIEEVVIGRKVGYGIREIRLDKDTESISATKIRNSKS